MGRDRGNNDTTRSDFSSHADFDIPEDFRTCSNEGTSTDFWMAITRILASSSQGDVLENGYIILDDCGFADDEPVSVVKHDAASHQCGWMDVD